MAKGCTLGRPRPFDFLDKPREECGVFGVYAPGQDVARLTYYGLYALQHRGQESAGIAVGDGRRIQLQKGMGLVADVFSHERLESFSGHVAVGHVRYSTTGSSHPVNAQPLVFRYAGGMIGVAHNGNLTNTAQLRSHLAASGSVFQSTTDSEVFVNLIARYSQGDLVDALLKCTIDVKGAYALLVLTEKHLIGLRDPHGIRPLCLGQKDGAYLLASESCAIDAVGAEFVRDVEPGEVVLIGEEGVISRKGPPVSRRAHCIFEYIYFARPDSRLDGFSVGRVRRQMGRTLAREYQVEADVVIGVPDSGTYAARGFAEESGIPLEEGLMKNRYVGRTFIQPTQSTRDLSVRLKLNAVRDVVAGKRVVVVDDSVVRGTTSGKIVSLLREGGAKEVHYCLSSPPVIKPCFYGIDTSNEEELIAARKKVEEIRTYIGADGLCYLSLEGLLNVFGDKKNNFCTACFSGDYPVEVPDRDEAGKYALE